MAQTEPWSGANVEHIWRLNQETQPEDWMEEKLRRGGFSYLQILGLRNGVLPLERGKH